MSRESPRKALLVVLLTAMVCSGLVSAAVVVLRPIQLNNQLLDRSRNIMALTGLLPADSQPDDDEMLALFRSLDSRLVNIDSADFNTELDPFTFDKRRAAGDRELGTAIPPEEDIAGLGRRSLQAPVFLVWDDEELDRIILPVRGSGMWSTLRGYIALQSDFNTIAGMTFNEQNETPGLGDQITHEHWLQQWQGRQIYDGDWVPVFRVSEGVVEEGSAFAQFEVDALTGATVTGNAVTAMIHYWFGPHGYRDFLVAMETNPPVRPEADL